MRQTCRRITSTWNAGSDSLKGTSAAYTATSTVGSASSTKAPRCSWPSMRTWRTRNRSQRRSYGPTATARRRRVSGRPCSAVRLCAGLAPRKNALCYWLNSNTAIWRVLSFLSDRCIIVGQAEGLQQRLELEEHLVFPAPKDRGQDRSRVMIDGMPEPTWVGFAADKRPHFVHLGFARALNVHPYLVGIHRLQSMEGSLPPPLLQ